MKLAIVCRDLRGLGGTTRTVIEHARFFTAKDCEVDVLTYRFDRERLEAAGARVRRVPGIPWTPWKRRLFAFAADRMARDYDFVHGHGDNLSQDVLSLHNCVHATHEAVHGTPLPESDAVGRLHERQLREAKFQKLICNSKLMAEDVSRRFGVPSEKIEVIYPGHDPKQFNAADKTRFRSTTRAELGFSDSDVVVGLITSGDFAKRGVGRFIAALGGLKKRGAAFKAVIVGKEARLGPYRKLVVDAGLAGDVSFPAPRPDVEKLYHALDVYCHPAFYEEFGQSVQEALACGLPVICGRQVGAAELLPASMRDFLVTPGTNQLQNSLAVLVGDAGLRARLAADAPGAVSANTWMLNAQATARALASVKR